MSIARHHAEWLSLVETSGPFLSLQVLLEAFPQGLEAHDAELFSVVRQAYGEWVDHNDHPGIHRAWVEWVLAELLGFPERVLLSGQAIPMGLQVTITEHHLTLRPDWVVVDPTIQAPRLLVQMVPPDQGLEKTLKASRWKASPATAIMELLRGTGVRLGLLTNGEQWMLVYVPKGESVGYASWYSNLWLEERLTLRAFRSLLGVRRFFAVEAEETLEALFAKSKDAQQEVTDQLGLQVRKAVEMLVQAIDRIDQDRQRTLLSGLSETVLYQAALTVMMRLVFLLSAEERELLLLGDPLYDQFYAVSTLRAQLRELADQYGEELLERRHDAWVRLLATFRAVFGGIHHDALRLPAYGGQLFDPDRFPFLEGRSPETSWQDTAAAPLPIHNRTVLHLLEALQILQVKVPGGGAEPRKLSFRALDIEQIGHVYEGLLDHTAVRATETILGLVGTKNKEPEVALSVLEGLSAKGEADLLAYLQKATGRSQVALRKAMPTVTAVASGTATAAIAPTDGLDVQARSRLLIACHNDSALMQRVLPWVKLIRVDTFDYPVVIPQGSVFVTQGSDRRETGTHYTPRSLTEEIVKYTLEPLVYVGVAEGKPRAEWQLKSAAELLALKICDMAMGSGAFLVQVCRYLSERVVEAWEREIDPQPPSPLLPRETGGQAALDEGNAEAGEHLPPPSPLSLGRGVGGEGQELIVQNLAGQLRQIPRELLERAKALRQQQTPAEAILWECLRDRRLHDAKFRRQHNIDRFIADFYCHQARLVIELDGDVHATSLEQDAARDEWMTQHGFRVLRFTNQQVFDNLEEVLASIAQALAPQPPSPLLPRETGGQAALDEGNGTPLSLGRGAGGEGLRILPDGSLSNGDVGEAILPADPDERLAVARRLVADRCLYGVDKNPMAVEMAKLSLWLITLQKNRPFTFLDHALRCGDSLLGVTRREQIEFLHLNPDQEAVQLRTVSEIWRPLLAQAIAKRQELESFTVNDIDDLARKAALQAEAEALTRNIKIAADYLIGEALAQAGKTGNLKLADLSVLSGLVTDALAEPQEQERQRKLEQIQATAQRMLNAGNPTGQSPRVPFHWALEFPEVFLAVPHPPSPRLPREKGGQVALAEGNGTPLSLGRGAGGEGGFSAIVGNPPFQGGSKITGTVGTDYREFLVENIARDKRGNADLCAFFFLNAGQLIQADGLLGLVATNTIAQGDTREVGLDQLLANHFVIPRAISSIPWPGSAALEVAYVWLKKGRWKQSYILDNQSVDGITSFLKEPGKALGKPYPLINNKDKSFLGSKVYGQGFVIEIEEAEALIAKNSKNRDVLFPYLNGEDLNSRPDQSPSRWVINFWDWPLDADHDDPKKPKGAPYAADYPDCLAIVEEKVKPERAKNNRKLRRERWWQYGEVAPGLYAAIAECDRVLVTAAVSPTTAFHFAPNNIVFAHKLIVFPIETYSDFGILQSTFHREWAYHHSSTLGGITLNYSPSDCFETFPFPETLDNLEAIGEAYYTHRQTIMQTRQEGLTKTYNRFHDPNETAADIQQLRDLHIQLDRQVAISYGWHDLVGPHPLTPSPQGEGEQERVLPPSSPWGEGGRGGEGLGHGFHTTKQGLRFTLSDTARREVLDRLLALNHQRHAEEVAEGLHDKKTGKGKQAKGKRKTAVMESNIGHYTTQGTLFGDPPPTQGQLF